MLCGIILILLSKNTALIAFQNWLQIVVVVLFPCVTAQLVWGQGCFPQASIPQLNNFKKMDSIAFSMFKISQVFLHTNKMSLGLVQYSKKSPNKSFKRTL